MRWPVTLIAFNYFLTVVSGDYWKDREDLLKREHSRMIGASLVLGEEEQLANKILMEHKLKELDEGFKSPGAFAPARHFFNGRHDAEKSKVLDFIKGLPKGAALHAHDTGVVGEEFLYDLTFRQNLYACKVDGRLRLRFMSRPDMDKTCQWTLVSTLRKEDPDYDRWLRSQLTLTCENPREAFGDVNEVWKAFEEVFQTVDPLIMYKPVFEDYLYQYLKELYEDNVMYTEIRGTLQAVYELDGSTYDPVEIVGFYESVFGRFKTDHPNFWGAKFIYSPFRGVGNDTLRSYVDTLKLVSDRYPDVVVGFDFIGQEDLGRPLSEFVAQLLPLSNNYSFYFHAGETNWYGSTSDLNLVDAMLLGTKRIGHGYSLTKHPQLLDIIKRRQIAVEVSPISNQVLMLVEDMRNHPAAFLIADDYPVVITADDPSFWSAKGLSYDFYMVFMGMAGRNADLRLLKQLAINSLRYSAMPEIEKRRAIDFWQERWRVFIGSILSEAHLMGKSK